MYAVRKRIHFLTCDAESIILILNTIEVWRNVQIKSNELFLLIRIDLYGERIYKVERYPNHPLNINDKVLIGTTDFKNVRPGRKSLKT